MSRHIFVTGATGYIGKHIVLRALAAGHSVTGSSRDPAGRADAYHATLRRHLPDPAAADRLRLVRLEAADDAAMAGCDALIHTASPVPIWQPKNPDDIVRPAVESTQHALHAAKAAGIERVVVTSSSSAVTNTAPAQGGLYDETCWSDLSDPALPPYPRAKTMAEQAAWATAAETGQALTVLNPVFVIGPPLDAEYGASIEVVAKLLRGAYPLLPRHGMNTVDVHDVAAAHLAVLDRDATVGQRLLLSETFLWLRDIAALLAEACPDRRVPGREAPDMLVRTLGLADRSIRALGRTLGQRTEIDNARARAALDMTFRDSRAAVRDTATVLDREGWLR